MKRFFALIVLILNVASAQATLPPVLDTIAPMLKTVTPSVVNIRVDVNNPNQQLPYQQDPTQPGSAPMHPAMKMVQLGSGVIIDAKKGYILTNAHLLKNAKTITVTLQDSRQFTGKMIGMDPSADVGVLEITAEKLKAITLGNSEKLQVGDFVSAIGSPFGLSQTVTSGIVSALQRNDLNIEGIENFIQTDAAINPGNSGGALVNFKGQLIGINTAIFAPSASGGNVGIGFAIPINMARSIMEQIIKYGTVHRGLLGIFAQPLTADLIDAFHLSADTIGTVITSVTPDSPATKAGLKVGDIILSINGQKVKDPFEVRNVIGLLRVGSRIELQVLRQGKTLDKSAVITDGAEQERSMLETQPFLTGLSLADLGPIVSSVHGEIGGGVQVITVSEASLAATAGLIPGDIIVSANEQKVKNIVELYQAAKLNKKMLLLNVIRGPGALFIVIK